MACDSTVELNSSYIGASDKLLDNLSSQCQSQSDQIIKLEEYAVLLRSRELSDITSSDQPMLGVISSSDNFLDDPGYHNVSSSCSYDMVPSETSIKSVLKKSKQESAPPRQQKRVSWSVDIIDVELLPKPVRHFPLEIGPSNSPANPPLLSFRPTLSPLLSYIPEQKTPPSTRLLSYIPEQEDIVPDVLRDDINDAQDNIKASSPPLTYAHEGSADEDPAPYCSDASASKKTSQAELNSMELIFDQFYLP
eukprot:GHVH01004175.1.p1 GENE.GHVH01004175.1~~GHVH01004175.1.p1  ORF type:complete len:250 (-),score=24.42 GHVH01004175.1:254-1003(-)